MSRHLDSLLPFGPLPPSIPASPLVQLSTLQGRRSVGMTNQKKNEEEEKPDRAMLPTRKRYKESVEEVPYTASLKRKRSSYMDHPRAGATNFPIQPAQRGCGPSSIQAQDHPNATLDQFRESGYPLVLAESTDDGLSGRGDSTKNELQLNQNTSFFPSSSNFQVVDSHFNSFRDVIINVNRPKNDETVFVQVPTRYTTSGEMRMMPKVEIKSTSRAIQMRKSSEIYYRHLLTLGRGSPLWIPEPSTSLPIEYQKAGIGIGDVGILKGSGGFDFLFNVYQPQNDPKHPINPRTMPDGFAPLDPPEERDINSHVEFKSHSFLASSHVNSRHDGTSGFVFESSAEDGAILTMPKGANSVDLDNMGMLRKYISMSIEKWYTYANEVRGRDVANGDLRLVIGKTSATTWGMATFVAEFSDEVSISQLNFKPTHPENASIDSDGSSPNYRWDYSGNLKAEVKSGPDEDEIEKLRKFDRLKGGDGQTAYANQCLFVRTINITLQDERHYSTDIGQPRFAYEPEEDASRTEVSEYDAQKWQHAKLSRISTAPVKDGYDDHMNVDEVGEVAVIKIPSSFEGRKSEVEARGDGPEEHSPGLGFSPPALPANTPSSNFTFSPDNPQARPSENNATLSLSPTLGNISGPHTLPKAETVEKRRPRGRPPKPRAGPEPLTTAMLKRGRPPKMSNAEPEPPSNLKRKLRSNAEPGTTGDHTRSTPENAISSWRVKRKKVRQTARRHQEISPGPIVMTRARKRLFNIDPAEAVNDSERGGDDGAGSSSKVSRTHAPDLPVIDEGNGGSQTLQEFESSTDAPGPLESSPPLPSHLHPSKVINEYLLNLVREAKMAITEDRDWILVLQESDTTFPADDVLLSRIKEMYDVDFEDGVVFLRNKSHAYNS